LEKNFLWEEEFKNKEVSLILKRDEGLAKVA
jgi:hypothetical protein